MIIKLDNITSQEDVKNLLQDIKGKEVTEVKKNVKKKQKVTTKKPRKTPAKKPTKKVGRPPVINDEKLKKLREAFMMGCTDDEACLYAEIEPRTFYNFQKWNEEFIQQKEHWKNNPILKARKVVFDKIEAGDENTAKWYLERKAKQEFSTKTEIGMTDKKGNDRNFSQIETLNSLLWNTPSDEIISEK